LIEVKNRIKISARCPRFYVRVGCDPPRLIFAKQLRRRAPAGLIFEIDIGERWPLASRTMKQVVVSSTFQGAAETCRPSL
jgi:hypothetical protein